MKATIHGIRYHRKVIEIADTRRRDSRTARMGGHGPNIGDHDWLITSRQTLPDLCGEFSDQE